MDYLYQEEQITKCLGLTRENVRMHRTTFLQAGTDYEEGDHRPLRYTERGVAALLKVLHVRLQTKSARDGGLTAAILLEQTLHEPPRMLPVKWRPFPQPLRIARVTV
jgi:hypothetical protein